MLGQSQSTEMLPNVKHVIAVASGKGGVGKSTVAANLALALADTGAATGLLDLDVYGPSVPIMFGVRSQPETTDGGILPIFKHGIKIFSIGFLTERGTPIMWRGPMIGKFLSEAMGNVRWGELDYLIVDMPPGCLTADTLVFTDQGPVPMSEMREGAYVYSFDGCLNKAGAKSPWELQAELVRRKVLAVIPQGKAEVFELRTPTRNIRGTADHPILVLQRTKENGSRVHHYSLEWRHLAQLKPGDVILTVKKLPQHQGESLRLPSPKAQGRIPLRIPDHSSTGLLRLVGYFLGDGSVRMSSEGSYWGVWFSEPEGGAYRATYVQSLKTLFNLSHIHQQPSKFAALSAQVAELFDNLGLHEKALNKTVPNWVFTLPTDQKLALIEGYCDADGHRRTAKAGHRRSGWMCFESPNKRLLEGLRALCIDVGFKVGNLNHRTRQVRVPSTQRVVATTLYSFEANRTAKTDLYGAGLIRGHRIGKGLRHDYIGFERVKEVKPAGCEEVYDLHVEGEHNFVANGLIVHNTGDAALSLAQAMPVTGTIIVTTPQDVALEDVMRSAHMFERLRVPLVGVVENMSYYVCPHCGERDEIFSYGGGRKAAEELGVPFLGEVPLNVSIRTGGDQGVPIVRGAPQSPQAKSFADIAENVVARLKEMAETESAVIPMTGL